MAPRYSDYEYLKFDYPADRVLRVTMERRDAWNGVNAQMHTELARIWPEIDKDPDVNAVIYTGWGKSFSPGGTAEMCADVATTFDKRVNAWRETKDIAYGIINCMKPIVSAIRGPAYGGACAAGLLADVSIASKTAKIMDGHAILGVAAGDGGALIWPLHCGMAKAKYYLMTCEMLSGEEAERIGLVSLVVEDDQLEAKSIEVATKLATGPQTATRWTKYSLNNWYRLAGPTFDASLALELMSFPSPEMEAGLEGMSNKRPGDFPKTTMLNSK